MDALAVGLIFMVLTSLYMGFQQFRAHRLGIILSFTLGLAVFCFFMWGLAWIG